MVIAEKFKRWKRNRLYNKLTKCAQDYLTSEELSPTFLDTRTKISREEHLEYLTKMTRTLDGRSRDFHHARNYLEVALG
jgi:hypothetical protein